MSRKLVLKRETIAELSGPDLGRVGGGTAGALPHTFPCLGTVVCPVTALVTMLMECPTGPHCPELTAPNCTGTCTTL